MNNEAPAHWYKEPWFWLVMSPLILVLVTSTFTVSIAFYFADDVVSDNYYREGRMLEKDFTAEDYARSIGLNGEVAFDFDSGELIFTANQAIRDAELSVLISHPAEADRDRIVDLRQVTANRFRADIDSLLIDGPLVGRWYLRLSARSAEQEVWRLVGEIHFADSTTVVVE